MKNKIKWIAALCAGLAASVSYGASTCDSATQICGVNVLIQQYVQSPTTVINALKLMPNVTQLHLRIDPSNGQSTVPSTVTLVEAIRKGGYTNELVFHPNNYKDEADWNCGTGDWQCVLKASLTFMDAVNQQVKQDGYQGFSSYSIEQSYLEPQDNTDVLAEKEIVIQHMSTDGQPITYGYVSPTCAPSTGTSGDLYGPPLFDYGYPQMYNLWKAYTSSDINKENEETTISTQKSLDDLSFPAPPAGESAQESYYSVMDANTEGNEMCDSSGQSDSTIDCVDSKGHKGVEIFVIPGSLRYTNHPTDVNGTVYEPGVLVPTIDASTVPTIAGFVAEAIALNYTKDDACWKHLDYMYFTLSGETDFLGGVQWTVPNINLFLTTLQSDLSQLGIPNTNQMKYAIWGFDMMNVLQPPKSTQLNQQKAKESKKTYTSAS
jgi:hypothetical protein